MLQGRGKSYLAPRRLGKRNRRVVVLQCIALVVVARPRCALTLPVDDDASSITNITFTMKLAHGSSPLAASIYRISLLSVTRQFGVTQHNCCRTRSRPRSLRR